MLSIYRPLKNKKNSEVGAEKNEKKSNRKKIKEITLKRLEQIFAHIKICILLSI